MSEVNDPHAGKNLPPNQAFVRLMKMLERHTRLWESEASLCALGRKTEVVKRTSGAVVGDCVICYNNLLRGEESVEELEAVRRLAGRPIFYRLNYIRQLSTTHMSVDLDGCHNRLSHSLGTLDIASRFISGLRKKGVELSPIEVKAVLVYALAHDCFHGPMGHTLDLIRDVLWGAIRERVDKHLLLKQVDRINQLTELRHFEERDKLSFWREIRTLVAATTSECEQIFKLLAYFADYDEIEGEDPSLTFLREIVDSDLDADRLDYLWRDHVHLTMTELPESVEIDDLISSVRVLERGEGRHLHYDVRHKATVERLLSLRVKYYSNFYEHPLKTVADEMLVHAVYYALDGAGLFEGISDVRRLSELADRFAYLTDEGLLEILTDIASGDDQIVPLSLLRDFRLNKPFQVVHKRGLRRSEFGHLTRRIVGQQRNLQSILREEEPNIKRLARQTIYDFDRKLYRDVIEKFNQQVKKPVRWEFDPDPLWRETQLEYSPDEDVYHIQLICGDGFRKKFFLEQMLWDKLLKHEVGDAQPFSDVLTLLAVSMAGNRAGDAAFLEGIKRRLEATPLVFITLSWMPGGTEQDLLNHKRGLSQGGIRFHDNGEVVENDPDLEVKSGDLDYFLLISAPALLAEIPGMKELITKKFDELLEGRAWVLWSGSGLGPTWAEPG